MLVSMTFKKVVVTGSSGTIGTALCERLIESGAEVACVDKKPNKWNDKIDGMTIRCDLCDPSSIKRLPADADMVVHLAANARVYELVKNPSMARDNFEMLFNTLEYCRTNRIKNVIFASSREVYGNVEKDLLAEDDAILNRCESPYTASKIAGEAMIHSYRQCYGINFVIIRLSNVYGMYDDSNRVVPLFIRMSARNEDITVFGKDKFLDFTYIDDAVSGITKCMENFDKAENDVYNIATGTGISILDLARLIKGQMKSSSKIIIRKNRPGEVVRFVADTRKARERLGFSAKISVEEGIKKSIEWYTDKYGLDKN
jgi:nucleoside-diphosphate-sugar epimerase